MRRFGAAVGEAVGLLAGVPPPDLSPLLERTESLVLRRWRREREREDVEEGATP